MQDVRHANAPGLRGRDQSHESFMHTFLTRKLLDASKWFSRAFVLAHWSNIYCDISWVAASRASGTVSILQPFSWLNSQGWWSTAWSSYLACIQYQLQGLCKYLRTDLHICANSATDTPLTHYSSLTWKRVCLVLIYTCIVHAKKHTYICILQNM